MAKKKEENKNMFSEVTAYQQLPIGQVTEDAYIRFGGYCNTSRVLPDYWGMKPSYRRLIHAALQFPSGQVVHTNELVGKMSATHPHSLTGIDDVVRAFTKKGIRYDSNGNPYRGPSVFWGKGNFGQVFIDGEVSPAAANRYTSVRLSDEYIKIIGPLWKEVPQVESPGGAMEPHHIPLPIPLSLISPESILGLGVGIRTTIPSFSPQSLYNAYINNNPMLLESNIDLILDKNKSDLKSLWTKGYGNIVYSYHLTRIKSDDGKTEGVLFSGDTGMGTVSFNKKINKWIEENKVVIDNVSDQNGPKLLISRVPNSRGITIDEIALECEKICRVTIKAELNITDGLSGFRVPLYNWLDYVYKDYVNLLNQVNLKKIKGVEFEIGVQNSIPLVVDYIMNKNPKAENSEIEKALGLSEEIVSTVMSKPISYLRKNKDTTERVKDLKNKLSELKKFNAIKFTENIISQL